MAKKFGTTWWGQSWLQSLSNIDFSNRLPRGATYARKGMVEEVLIGGNKILSKVAGSRRTPYSVDVVVPKFTASEINKLMEALIQRPIIISKLLNKELDPEIMTLCSELGIQIFPKQWKDLSMDCSCPDWAVPCKHLASVIYKISEEIDNDPFLIFRLHGVDLFAELEKRGVSIDQEETINVPRLSDILERQPEVSEVAKDPELVYQRINYTTIPNIFETVVQLLPENPVFAENSKFNKQYKSKLVNVRRNIEKLLKSTDNTIFDSRLEPSLTPHSDFSVLINSEGLLEVEDHEGKPQAIFQLIDALYQIKSNRLFDYQPNIVALHHILYFTIQLLQNGAIVPQILEDENGDVMVRWLPAILEENVRNIVEKLVEITPENLLYYSVKEDNQYLFYTISDQIQHICSGFITLFIHYFSMEEDDDKILDLFFSGIPCRFNQIGEKGKEGSIKAWLERYHLQKEGFRPVLQLTETTEELFHLELKMESETTQTLVSLEEVSKSKAYDNQRFQIFQVAALLSNFIPKLNNYINKGAKEPMEYDLNDLAPLLTEIIPTVELLAVKTILPRSLSKLLRPKPSIKLDTKSQSKDSKTYMNLKEMLSFEWRVAIGEHVIDENDFQSLTQNASQLIRFKGRYIYLEKSELAKLEKSLNSTKNMDGHQLLQAALAEEFEGAPVAMSDEMKQLMKELTSKPKIELPEGLNATLRPYQERGYSWMYRNSQIGLGSIIADDMGLGKTLQVISLLLRFKQDGAINDTNKAVVVVPTSLLTNWVAEIEKFAPNLSVFTYHGPNRKLETFDHDVLLTSYGVMRSDAKTLKKEKWQVLVIDEAQNIKNTRTEQTKAVKGIKANVKIAMSGTPVENRLSEFWSIMDFSNKGYLGAEKGFNSNYAKPIQLENDVSKAERFRKITAPFMMRRMKTDKTIISDLPDKIEQNQYINLTPTQASLYEETLNESLKVIAGMDDNESQFKRQGLILQMILALKQICNHPTQYLKNGVKEPELSGKMEVLFDLVSKIIDRGEKVLIFSQFREMGDLITEFIEQKLEEKPMFYHGGCSVKQRQEMVDRFQNNHADKVFVLSLKAAGTGLNLTAASHVIHFDLWWNPAVEAQATDRAYRIGQKSNVHVHRFVTKNTFEEKIDAMIQDKKRLADMTVSSGENWIGQLSNKELKELFG